MFTNEPYDTARNRHFFAADVLHNAPHSARPRMTSTTVHVLDTAQLCVGTTIDTPPLPALPTSPRPRRHSDHSTTITSTDPYRRHQPIHHHHEQQPLQHNLTRTPPSRPTEYPNTNTPTPIRTHVHHIAARRSETLRACRRAPQSGRLRQHVRPLGYDESVARDIVRQWSEEEFFADALPPTDDDVPIALDGRVLDSPEKVIAYLDEINRRRVTSSADG